MVSILFSCLLPFIKSRVSIKIVLDLLPSDPYHLRKFKLLKSFEKSGFIKQDTVCFLKAPYTAYLSGQQ